MIDIEKMKALAKKFRIVSGHVGQFRRHMLDDYRDAATVIDTLISELEVAKRERDELRAARIAYASEFETDAEGLPGIGNIHANIRKLKAELEAREADRRDAERYRWLRTRVIYEGSSDWTIEVSGRFASFEEALEYQMSLAQRQEGEDDERA